MLRALGEGNSVALTADVPKVARVAGLGIVKMRANVRPADLSGRGHHQPADVLDNWDRTTINLPFGRGAGVAGAPIHVPPDADDGALEPRAGRSRRRSTR